MGAAALLIAGAILTSILQLYFSDELSGEGIVRSRWWWEIVMNLQVLCLALMWFCYADRVSDNVGAKKRVMRLRMWLGLLIVLQPFWVALLSAYMNWFVVRPSLEVIDLLIWSMLAVWMLAVYVPRFMIVRARPNRYKGVPATAILKPRAWYYLLPTYAILVIVAVELQRGGTLHYQSAPFLLYLQGAIPYIARGISWRRVPNSTF